MTVAGRQPLRPAGPAAAAQPPAGVAGCSAATRLLLWTPAAAQSGAAFGLCFAAAAAGVGVSGGGPWQRCFSVAVGKCRSRCVARAPGRTGGLRVAGAG